MSTYTTLNPLDKAFITLSGGNLTFLGTGGSGGVRAVDPQQSGKFYFECLYTTVGGSDSGVGISKSSAGFAGLQNNAAGGCIAYHGFAIYNNGSSTGINPGSLNSGTTMGVAVDLTASKIWFTVDGTHWNSTTVTNDPGTGSGGISISGITGVPLYPCILAENNGDTGTCNFGDSAFHFTAPTGFGGWPIPAPVDQQPNLGPIPIMQRIARFYEDDILSQEWSPNQRLRNYHMTWARNLPSEAVSKFVQYDVLTAPDALDVSKFVQYDVLGSPDAIDVAKFVQYDVLTAPDALDVAKFVDYVVLEFSPQPQLPNANRLQRQQAIEWEAIDNEKPIRSRGLFAPKNAIFSIDGVAATAAVGTLHVEIDKPITGVSATAQIGTLGTDTAGSVTGVAATAAIGTLTPNVEPNVSGVSATAAVGSLHVHTDFGGLTGVQATASVGNLLTRSGPNMTSVAIVGVFATAQVGDLTSTNDFTLTGVEATAEIGAVRVVTHVEGLTLTSLVVETVPELAGEGIVSLRWSDTKGASWSFPIRQSLGVPGNYRNNVQFRGLGQGRDRIFDLSWSSSQATALTGLFVETQESSS